MTPLFFGFDHVDVRVRSLAAVEAFYDALLPELGLPAKSFSFVAADGTWSDSSAHERYNTVEYSERSGEPRAQRFIGFIEDPAMRPVATRIAFALSSASEVRAWAARLEALGAREVESDDDFDNYPAVFFEDPAGTRLELCARRAVRP
ncbi:MAG: VOC family protein [Candidatus Eremiobacteraeota bacterium]|nr:VOC family protein [Candidatus Eremiobacteraeota bacterium]